MLILRVLRGNLLIKVLMRLYVDWETSWIPSGKYTWTLTYYDIESSFIAKIIGKTTTNSLNDYHDVSTSTQNILSKSEREWMGGEYNKSK